MLNVLMELSCELSTVLLMHSLKLVVIDSTSALQAKVTTMHNMANYMLCSPTQCINYAVAMDLETKRLSDIVSWLVCASDSQMHDV